MMYNKDWATSLARRIHLLFDLKSIAPQDTSIPRLVEIIAEGGPFEVGVAYMPVPRCDGCRHWDKRDDYWGKLGAGRCGIIRKPDTKCWPSLNDDMMTSASFGCVQWEEKV